MQPLAAVLDRLRSRWSQATPGPAATPQPPSWACPQCHDAGWLRQRVADGPPVLVACACTEGNRVARRAARSRAEANLDEALVGLTFDRFDGSRQPAALGAAVELAWKRDHTLVLVGPPGTGKTHLAAACVNHLLALQLDPVYWAVPALLDHLRAGFGQGDPANPAGYSERYRALLDAPFVALDDLGAERATEWSDAALLQLVDHRYARHLPGIITTNLAIDLFPVRLASRLADRARSRVVVLAPGDYRRDPQRAQERGSHGQ